MRDRFSGYRDVVRQRFPTQRHPADLGTFEQRVVNVRRGFQRTVYQMVQTGVDWNRPAQAGASRCGTSSS